MTVDSLEQLFDRALTKAQRSCSQPIRSRVQRQDLDDLAHVLSVWHTDPQYVDRYGAPRILSQTGRSPSFESLTRLAIPSLPAKTALERLVSLECVSIDDRGRVRAVRRELVTRAWDEIGFSTWQHAVRRYLETLEFNYTIPGQGRFERTARSERLPAEFLPVFNRWVREQGASFVQMVDDWLTEHESDEDATDSVDLVAAGVGVYLFVDDAEQRP